MSLLDGFFFPPGEQKEKSNAAMDIHSRNEERTFACMGDSFGRRSVADLRIACNPQSRTIFAQASADFRKTA